MSKICVYHIDIDKLYDAINKGEHERDDHEREAVEAYLKVIACPETHKEKSNKAYHWLMGHGYYRCVACFDSYGDPSVVCEEAWFKTNTIDKPWFENPALDTPFREGCRSSMVGDVVEIMSKVSVAQNKYHMVASCGFFQLGLSTRTKLSKMSPHRIGY